MSTTRRRHTTIEARSGSVSADLAAPAGYAGEGVGLCASGRAVLRRLQINAPMLSVATDAGTLRVGQELWALSPRLRRALHDLNDPPMQSGFQVQDPCAQRAGTAALSGEMNSLLSTKSLRGVIQTIVVQPANDEQCKTQPTRAAFERAVLADGCALFGEPPTSEDGPPIDPDKGCRGRLIKVRVTRIARSAKGSTAVPDPTETGRSADGSVRWRMDTTTAIIEGRGLRAEVRATGDRLYESPTYDMSAAAARISTALGYEAKPSSDAVDATAMLRVKRPKLTTTIAAASVAGNADSSIRPLYRDGKRVGFAAFVYGIAPGGFGYGLSGTAATLREVCDRYAIARGCPQMPASERG